MIRDYSIYEMNEKEKLLFYSAGYAAIALVLFVLMFTFNIVFRKLIERVGK